VISVNYGKDRSIDLEGRRRMKNIRVHGEILPDGDKDSNFNTYGYSTRSS